MTREDILKLFDGKNVDGIDDIVKSILDINGKDTAKKQKTIDDYSEKYKDYEDIKSKLAEFEASKLSDQEKMQKALDEATKSVLQSKKELAMYKVKSVFAESGLVEDDYKNFIDSMNFENSDMALKCATGFANLLKVKTDAASKKAMEDAINSAPTPPATKVVGETEKQAPAPYTSAETLEMYK